MDFETGTETEELAYSYADEPPAYHMLCQLGETAFAFSNFRAENIYLVYKKAVLRPENQTTVKVALIGSNLARGDAEELNNMATDYLYECTEYGYGEDELNRLLTELMTGNGPDLLLFDGQVDTSSNYFEDLYPYIDNDPDISRELFLPNLLPALEVKGELHELWTGMQISTLAARASDVGENKNLKVAGYFRIMEENEEYLTFFQTYIMRSVFLSWIATVSSAEFVDWENGTCNFNDPAFAELLAWCQYMAADYEGSRLHLLMTFRRLCCHL